MKPLVIVLAVTAALVLAACGGDDDGDTTTVTTQESAESPAEQAHAKEQFISEADEICTDYRAQLDPIDKEFDEVRNAPPSVANDRAGAELLDQAAELSSEEFDELQALTPPPGDEVVLDRYYQAASESMDVVSELAAVLRTPQDGLQEVERLNGELEARSSEAQGLAQGYGFKVCGSG